MSKNLILGILVLFSTGKTFSQGTFTAYLQVKGEINMFDEVHLVPPSDKRKPLTKADSLIDYNAVQQVFTKANDPVSIMNSLANEGWLLHSVTWVTKNPEDVHRYPFLLYYFKKEIVIPQR